VFRFEMGSGASSPEPSRTLERRVSTISASPSATVITSSATPQKKPLACTVMTVRTNNKVGFMSSVPGAEDKVVVEMVDRAEGSSRYMLQVGDLTSTLTHIFPSLLEAQEMSIAQLLAPRVCYAVPQNFSFGPIGGHASAVRSVACSADGGQYVVTLAGRDQCSMYDSKSGAMILSVTHPCAVLTCSMSRTDAKFFATNTMESITMWDTNNGKRLREISFQESTIVVVSEESDAVVAASSIDNAIHVWDPKTCEQIATFGHHQSAVVSLAVSHKGQLVVSGGVDGELFVWYLTSGELRHKLAFHSSAVFSASFSLDGQRLCSIDRDNLVVWDLFTGTLVLVRSAEGAVQLGRASSTVNNGDVRFTTCCFCAANLVVVATNFRQLLILDPNTAAEILSLSTKGIVTSSGGSWNGDILIFGDNLGNMYKLQLSFGAKHVVTFNLNSKPAVREKGKMD